MSEKTPKENMEKEHSPLICSTCGAKTTSGASDAVFERGYYWHVPCYVPDSFPSAGKLIRETIMTEIGERDVLEGKE